MFTNYYFFKYLYFRNSFCYVNPKKRKRGGFNSMLAHPLSLSSIISQSLFISIYLFLCPSSTLNLCLNFFYHKDFMFKEFQVMSLLKVSRKVMLLLECKSTFHVSWRFHVQSSFKKNTISTTCSKSILYIQSQCSIQTIYK
jgi:hypothetical protein